MSQYVTRVFYTSHVEIAGVCISLSHVTAYNKTLWQFSEEWKKLLKAKINKVCFDCKQTGRI
jgi:hypothetical protein